MFINPNDHQQRRVRPNWLPIRRRAARRRASRRRPTPPRLPIVRAFVAETYRESNLRLQQYSPLVCIHSINLHRCVVLNRAQSIDSERADRDSERDVAGSDQSDAAADPERRCRYRFASACVALNRFRLCLCTHSLCVCVSSIFSVRVFAYLFRNNRTIRTDFVACIR